MILIVRDSNNDIYKWVVKKLSNGEHYANTLTVGLIKDKAIIAGFIFYKPNADNVIVSAYANSAEWAHRHIIKTLANTVCFDILGAKIITAYTNPNNTKANKLLQGLGFVLKGVISADRADGSDNAVYQLTQQNFKFREVLP
jgi:hypothetical protein